MLAPRLAWGVALMAALLALPQAALAHTNGGPWQLAQAQPAGPYLVSVWADPHVGGGQMWVQVVQPAGAAPGILLDATPSDGHRTGRSVAALQGGHSTPSLLGALRGAIAGDFASVSTAPDTWVAMVPFDAAGPWSVAISLHGPKGDGQISLPVDVPDDGPSGFEALLAVFPFVLIAGAVLIGWRRHGHELRRRNRPAA